MKRDKNANGTTYKINNKSKIGVDKGLFPDELENLRLHGRNALYGLDISPKPRLIFVPAIVSIFYIYCIRNWYSIKH